MIRRVVRHIVNIFDSSVLILDSFWDINNTRYRSKVMKINSSKKVDLKTLNCLNSINVYFNGYVQYRSVISTKVRNGLLDVIKTSEGKIAAYSK